MLDGMRYGMISYMILYVCCYVCCCCFVIIVLIAVLLLSVVVILCFVCSFFDAYVLEMASMFSLSVFAFHFFIFPVLRIILFEKYSIPL